MKKLTVFDNDEIFYRGTIIVLKDLHKSPAGSFDMKYCMISSYGGGGGMMMLDLYKSIGGVIIHDIKPNVEGHFGVNKEGIKDWVREFFSLFLTKEKQKEYNLILDDIIHIEFLDDYFTQANRDLFMPNQK